MTADRHLIAYQLIANGLRRRGLSGSVDDVIDVLNRLPLPDVTRLEIIMAGTIPNRAELELREASRAWRAHQLSRNPFA